MNGWVITIIHVIIFFISRHLINKKKRILEREKAHLSTENEKLKGQIISYKRRLGNL